VAEIQIDPCNLVWAKSDRDQESRLRGGPLWNPLLAHMSDVAACVGALWDRYLARTVQRRLTDAFGLGDPARARAVVMFLAGLHDLGKASPCFLRSMYRARRYPDDVMRAAATEWERAARAAGLPLPTDLDSAPDIRHEHVTAALLPSLLGCDCKRCAGSGPDNEPLHIVAYLLGGHHGHIPDNDTVAKAPRAARPETWGPIHQGLVAALAASVGVSIDDVRTSVTMPRASVMPLFAGLVVLADWIASHTDWFTFRQPTLTPADYWHCAQAEASKALDSALLDRWDAREAAWQEIWPGLPPRPFQQTAIDLLPAQGQAFVLIESETGSGKTNLALWCARQLAHSNGYHGLYMAMPTQAATEDTARALRRFINADQHDQRQHNLAIVHANAQASAIAHALIDARLPSNTGQGGLADISAAHKHEPEDCPGERNIAVLDDWYLREHLGLISPFGIGTIDQLVLAAQGSRFWFLRLFGLANKTVIIDEAHAYQLYQERLFGAVIEWLADAGASVIVLSATLPASIRAHLVESWRRGLRTSAENEELQGPITVVDGLGRARSAAPAEPATPKHLHYELRHDPGIKSLARDVLAQGSAGGVTGVIRNRSAEAAALHTEALKQAEAQGWSTSEIFLIHGAQLLRDRQPVETILCQRLGAGPDASTRNSRRPDRMLVISTSVIEHTLDIDLDRLYSDLAPIDLLIQRCGRLHRHKANDPERPNHFSLPKLTILWKPDGGGVLPLVEPADRRAGRTIGNSDGVIHPPYTLAAAWHALQRGPAPQAPCRSPGCHAPDEPLGMQCLDLPEFTRQLIETTYGPPTQTLGPAGDLLTHTRAAWEVHLANEDAQAVRALHPYDRSGGVVGLDGLMSGDAHGSRYGKAVRGIRPETRLGETYVDVTILYKHPENGWTYDAAGTLKADLQSHRIRTPVQRQQARDLMLNTLKIPAHRFSGPDALPPIDTWPTYESRPALQHRNVLILSPEGMSTKPLLPVIYTPSSGLRLQRSPRTQN